MKDPTSFNPTNATNQPTFVSVMSDTYLVLAFVCAMAYFFYRWWSIRALTTTERRSYLSDMPRTYREHSQWIFVMLLIICCAIQAYAEQGSTFHAPLPWRSISSALVWMGVSVLLTFVPSFSYTQKCDYIYVTTMFYFAATLNASYPLFVNVTQNSIGTKSAWVNVVLCLVMFVTAITTPFPLNPAQIISTANNDIEIRNGRVYCNGRLLSPETTASLLSSFTTLWVQPLIIFGFRNEVTEKEMYTPPFDYLACAVSKEFADTLRWIEPYKIWKRVYTINKHLFIKQVFLSIICSCNYLTPYLRQRFLEYISAPEGRPLKFAYLYIFLLAGVSLLVSWCRSARQKTRNKWNARTHAVLNIELYKKVLRWKHTSGEYPQPQNDESDESEDLDDHSQQSDSAEKISEIITTASQGLAEVPSQIIDIAQALVEICIAISYLHALLGSSSFVGLAIMLALMPITYSVSKLVDKEDETCEKAGTLRKDRTTRLLQNIRVLKYLALETKWKEDVMSARNEEIETLRTLNYIVDVNQMLSFITPIIVTAGTFIWYTKVTGAELTMPVIFTSMYVFDLLPDLLAQLQRLVEAFRHIENELTLIKGFLEKPEVDTKEAYEPLPIPNGASALSVLGRVGFEECTIHYRCIINTRPQPHWSLKIPSFDFPIGEFSIVSGPTGCGKSSLLGALLGEIDVEPAGADKSRRCTYFPSKNHTMVQHETSEDPKEPTLAIESAAYVEQTPFIMQDTIRNNILFYRPLDQKRYEETLEQCALLPDLKMLENGDNTFVGVKGIQLSGGQQARVSLARAIYSNAKTILIDDCLSAVDAHTAQHIYKRCFNGPLLKDRTVIMVTHNVELCLPRAKLHVAITADGQLTVNENIRSSFEENDYSPLEKSDCHDDFAIPESNEPTEKKTSAYVSKSSTFRTYIAACGGWSIILLLVVIALAEKGSSLALTWWLKVWTTASEVSIDKYAKVTPSIDNRHQGLPTDADETISNDRNGTKFDINFYITIYILLCLFNVLLAIIRKRVISHGTLKGIRTLFERQLSSVIGAHFLFFEETPMGEILERFSEDLMHVDLQAISTVASLFESIIGFVAPAAIISSIAPCFFIVAVVIVVVCIILEMFYDRISSQLKAYSFAHRSPIHVHLYETLRGITTVRAYGQQERFLEELVKKLDTFTTTFYQNDMTSRWLDSRLDFFRMIVNFLCSLFILLNLDTVDVGTAGMALYYSHNYLSYLQEIIREITYTQLTIATVKRSQEYIDLEQEPSAVIQGHRPPSEWPSKATVEIKDLTMSYPSRERVLHAVSGTIEASQRVGIVGRTGSGKTTLFRALVRYMDPVQGTIKIDGVDITSIGKEDLRKKITIIAQEPMVLPGTVRMNLDPFNEHNDDAIWKALEQVNLVSSTSAREKDPSQGFSVIRSLSDQLYGDGKNYSQGQKQLLCMARALLRKSKLIILDEASASIDPVTDAKLQQTIRNEFTDATLICIAHRIRTIIDYDRVMVMEKGKIVEFDTPYNLIINEDSKFRSLCKQSDDFDELLTMIEKAHASRSS